MAADGAALMTLSCISDGTLNCGIFSPHLGQNNLKYAERFPSFKYLCDGFTQHYLHPGVPGLNGNRLLIFGMLCSLFTNISWRPAGRRHHAIRAFDLRQPKVTDHDLRIFIHAVVQEILWLQHGQKKSSTVNTPPSPSIHPLSIQQHWF